MAITQDCLDILRRRIGDIETPYTYTDDLLIGYIGDAVAQVELEYARNIDFQYGNFVLDANRYNPPNEEITMIDATLFAIRAHYLIVISTKTQADRNNFVMKKGSLTLDNTKQSKDHYDTLAQIEKEYKRALYQVRIYSHGGSSISGIRME